MNKGAPKSEELQKEPTNKSGLSENVKKIIGLKRKRRKSKK